MAVNEELIKIILSVGGQEAITSLTEQVRMNREGMEDLVRQWQAGAVATDDFMRSASKLANQEKELGKLLDQVTASAQQQNAAVAGVANTTGQVGKAAGMSANDLLRMGNTLDDLQYVGEMGLRPIINNVMQIAPAVGIAMIGLEVLRKMFGEKLVDALGLYEKGIESSKDKTKRLQEQIESLEKKPYKLAVDMADLDKAKAQLDDLEQREANRKAASGSTPEKSFAGESQKVVTDYLGGQDNLVNILTELEKQSGFVHGSATDLDAAKRLRAAIASPTIDARSGMVTSGGEEDKRMLEAIETRIAQAGREYVQKQIVDPFLAGDTKGIQTLQNIAERNPGAFARLGMDGRTGADAIGMMPKSIEELLQRRKETEMHAANTKAATEESEKQQKDDSYIQGLWNETAAKEKADKKAGIEEAERLQEQANNKKAAEAAKAKAASKAAIEKKKADAVTAAEKAAADRMKRAAEVQSSFVDVAQQNPGIDAASAARIAEEAVTLHRNFSIPIAQAQLQATQALMQGFSAVQTEYMKLRQQTMLLQQGQRQLRTVRPTNQNLPIN